jgi:hypothetical protein
MEPAFICCAVSRVTAAAVFLSLKAKGRDSLHKVDVPHRSIIDEIVGKGYGHTESGERLLRMHAQEVVELILKKAGKDVLKQIELAAAVKDRARSGAGMHGVWHVLDIHG